MVTIYTERGRVEEQTTYTDDYTKTRTLRLAAVSLGTGLLLSLIGAYNLSADVNDLTHNKVTNIQERVDNLSR